jgi:hypothetical protein
MAIKDLEEIDNKLMKMYENQVTNVATTAWQDRSYLLLDQMTFIALTNKSLLNIS